MYTVCAGVHECVSMSSGAHYYEMEWVGTINFVGVANSLVPRLLKGPNAHCVQVHMQ